MPPASVLSKTLQSITLTKIRELEKQRSKYEKSKATVLSNTKATETKREIISLLLKGVKELYPDAENDSAIKNIERWLHQSYYDSSVSDEMLDAFEQELRSKLEFQSRKLGLADLYSRLLTEWMTPSARESVDTDSEDNFEVLEKQKERLQELCDKFEQVVFEPLETNTSEIEKYLNGLFPDDESKAALKDLREQMRYDGESLLEDKAPFDSESLTWCIKGILAEDLLSDEKQKILRDFLENDLVLGEIADVLNMRYADFENWTWDAGEEGIPVLPRQGLNGKYRIWMDEDVLQAIFIHYIGVKWCVYLKQALTRLVNSNAVWKWDQRSKIPSDDAEKRSFFSGSSRTVWSSVKSERQSSYVETFFLSQLPSSVHSLYTAGAYDNDDVSESEAAGEDNSKKSSIKQQILRQLAAEVLLHRTLNGEAAVVQSDLQWYATGLSHTTIFTIMRFIGFSEAWISFFKKFLEAPLNLSVAADEPGLQARTRKRGVPMAHAPEKLIGELVLFVMDLTVSREAGATLYRLHDDLWLCGEPARCAKGWLEMGKFAKIAGLDFNSNKTGSVYLTSENKKQNPKIAAILPEGPVCIGFLTLDPESGDWIIDQAQVDKHVEQLKRQLDGCESILSWIQTWNSCIGRFFSHTFGEPASCFGKKHVDSILETHSRIEREIFGKSGNVLQHLRQKVAKKFGNKDIPDAFFYLPEQLGGLGLRNPFIRLLLLRDNIRQEPHEILEKFLEEEKAEYARIKKNFENETKAVRARRLKQAFPHDDPLPFNPEVFFTVEEFTKYRFATSDSLRQAYLKLLSIPHEKGIQGFQRSNDLKREFRDLKDKLGNSISWNEEEKWIIATYKKELEATIGGLRLIEQAFLPLGVLTMMRMKKVTWQMVL